ncbi:unnamed protein product, partial [Arabidopsis halleri]
ERKPRIEVRSAFTLLDLNPRETMINLGLVNDVKLLPFFGFHVGLGTEVKKVTSSSKYLVVKEDSSKSQ